MTNQAAPGPERQRPGCVQRVARVLVIAIVVYGLLGIVTTLVFVFLASGQVGSRALGEPQTYIICLLWPLALWQYFLLLLGLG